jgi:hypothetical protein
MVYVLRHQTQDTYQGNSPQHTVTGHHKHGQEKGETGTRGTRGQGSTAAALLNSRSFKEDSVCGFESVDSSLESRRERDIVSIEGSGWAVILDVVAAVEAINQS